MESDIEAYVETSRHHCHYFDQFNGSFALISPSESVSTAYVFVHGFGGNACGTWDDFHMMVDDSDWAKQFSSVDLYFFQYNSVWERIQSSTYAFLTFLDKVVFNQDLNNFVVNLSPFMFSAEGEPSENPSTEVSVLPAIRQYRRVVLVGHSEGGVVIRNAVDKKAKGNSQILKSDLRLFAPAIGGYAPAGLLGVLANSPFFGKLLDSLLRAAPAYQDLSGSDLLGKLQRKTEENAQTHKATPAFRARILWGSRDVVVKPDKYEDDEERFNNQNHTGVCKPDLEYIDPLEWVSFMEQVV